MAGFAFPTTGLTEAGQADAPTVITVDGTDNAMRVTWNRGAYNDQDNLRAVLIQYAVNCR